MSDPFSIREDCNVAWLKFKPTIGKLLTEENEPILRTIFSYAFAEGFGIGSESCTKAILDGVEKALNIKD